MIFYAYHDGRKEKFYNYTQLINWLSTFNGINGYNSFLDFASPTGKDIIPFTNPDGTQGFINRSNIVTQEDDISIYDNLLKSEVRAWRYVDSIEQGRLRTIEKDKTQKTEPDKWKYWKYRISKCHQWGHYGRGVNHRDLMNAADPEQIPYIRTARSLHCLPGRWCETWHKCSSSWKNSTKYRHQWEPKAARNYKKEKNKWGF